MSSQGRLVDKSYWVHEQLGQGGMATVFRATYRLTGDVVALKLVAGDRLESSGDTTSDSFRLRLALVREFQTLASLHHPNIVEVLGYGIDESRDPYFTMELLGRSQDIVQAAEGQPLHVKIDLLAQLLRALVYVHRRGLLHRDLKPSNVLCVGGQVKVLDFGIAVSANKVENIAGTLDYMAPEVLLGRSPTVASDLYAVGILAYQMLTGRYPYDRQSQTAFLAGIFQTKSDVTLSGEIATLLHAYTYTQKQNRDEQALNRDLQLADLTGPAGDVVRKLLSPEPEDRYPDAAAVIQALAEATEQSIAVETAATRESFLQASDLVGRHQELAQLSNALESTLQKTGSGWLLGGESGVGKSRLLAEVRTLAMVSGAVVAQGQAVTEGSSHYQLWLPILRMLCLHIDLKDADAAVLKELIPDLPDLLDRAIDNAPPVQPEFAEKRLFAVIESLFLNSPRPLVILLEDLQWAGADSLALLGRLSEVAQTRPLLLLGTYRDDEAPDLPLQLRRMRVMRLQRLDYDAIAELSASMLGEVGKQPWVIEYLAHQTEGNVFFLVEVVRAIAEQVGQLNSLSAASLPEQIFTFGIERIVEKRLEHVPKHYRKVLQVAATIGRKLDPQILAHMFPTFDLRTFLMDCANSAILEASEGDWRFVHDKLRQGLLDHIDAEQRRQLHADVVQVMESVYENSESHNAILAYHFQQAGLNDKASRYYIRAGENATRLCAYNDARKHFAAALVTLQLLPETDDVKRRKVDALIKQVQASHIADKPQKNLERLELAAQLLDSQLEPGTSNADLLRTTWVNFWFGRIYYYCDEMQKSLRYHKQVLQVAKEHKLNELFMRVSSASGTALFAQGRVDLALPHLDSSIETFAAMGYGYEWVRAVGHVGLCLIGLGQYERGMAELNRAHARALEIDKPIIISMTSLYYSVGCMHSGDWPFMLQRAMEGLDAAKQCGEKIYQTIALGFIAWAHNLLGNHEAALENYQSMQEITQEMGGHVLYGLRFEAAHVEMLVNVGRYEEAIASAKEVIATSVAEDSYNSWGLAERAWGLALHRSDPGQDAEVNRHMAASIEAFAQGGLALDVARTQVYWARICHERGEQSEAERLLSRGILQFRASNCAYALAMAKAIEASWQSDSTDGAAANTA
jgi:serine/threonine protein kinase